MSEAEQDAVIGPPECKAVTPEQRIAILEHALARSLRLQSHYAMLLNMHDGGKRMGFANAEEWIARLAAVEAECPWGFGA